MKIILILLLTLIPTLSRADFIASAGLMGGRLESENFSEDKPVFESPMYGFKGEIEFGFPYLTFFGAFDLSRGTGESQYDFTDPDDPSETATAEGLETTLGMSRATAGMRIKLIKLQKFRLYVGGGLHVGFFTLSYDKDDFKKKNDNTTGYEEYERQNLHGGFGEVGMEFIIDQNSGFRVSAQRTSMRTDQFQTLDREKLKFNYTTVAVSFIEYIETSSW